MERKTKIEIALAVLLILLLLGFFMWWRMQKTEEVATTATTTSHISGSNSTTSTSSSTGSSTTETTTTAVVKETSPNTVARTFVERIGSYSSEADAANIEDILPMATASFQKQLEQLAKESRAAEDGSYYGVSTVVLTAPKTVSSTATQIVLSMTTQREETIDEPGNTSVRYQDITITLVKSGTTWLVDGYTWK